MILCDSGSLIAAAASNDVDHHACTELFTGLRLAGRRLLVPQTVVAEVGYMLAEWVSSEVEAKFLDAVAPGDFEVVNLTTADCASAWPGGAAPSMGRAQSTETAYPVGQSEIEVTEEQKGAIRSRVAELQADPSIGLTWDELNARIGSRWG